MSKDFKIGETYTFSDKSEEAFFTGRADLNGEKVELLDDREGRFIVIRTGERVCVNADAEDFLE